MVPVKRDAKWKWARVEVPENGEEFESRKDQGKCAQHGLSLCVQCEWLYTGPMPPS